MMAEEVGHEAGQEGKLQNLQERLRRVRRVQENRYDPKTKVSGWTDTGNAQGEGANGFDEELQERPVPQSSKPTEAFVMKSEELSRLIREEPSEGMTKLLRVYDDAGASWSKVAKKLGVNFTTVWRWRITLETTLLHMFVLSAAAIDEKHRVEKAEIRSVQARKAGKLGGWPKGKPRKTQ